MPYASKTPNADGLFDYSDQEVSVWRDLFRRQMDTLRNFACDAYLEGQRKLGFSPDAMPQVKDIDARLQALTGAGVEPVAALIPQDQFSRLLAARKFPVATFIRRREHIDYIQEPDIFHEVFGHCPMLTDEAVCVFFERFGRLALSLPKDDLPHLFRLFWFTIEFGLIREGGRTKAFGAGIISSPAEAAHAADRSAEILPYDPRVVLRTPYRIDIVQPVYFEIESFAALAASLNEDISALIAEAKAKGDIPPRFDAAA